MSQRGIEWLRITQNSDGGWGEHPSSYYSGRYLPAGRSFATQTGWALEALAAVCPETEAAVNAADFLISSQLEDGSWPSFPTSAAQEIYENSIDALIVPAAALGRMANHTLLSRPQE